MAKIPPCLIQKAAVARRLQETENLRAAFRHRFFSSVELKDRSGFIRLPSLGNKRIDEKLRAVQFSSAVEIISQSATVMWRGDLIDAATRGHEALVGTATDLDTLPLKSEFWILDPDGPPSAIWSQLEHEAAVTVVKGIAEDAMAEIRLPATIPMPEVTMGAAAEIAKARLKRAGVSDPLRDLNRHPEATDSMDRRLKLIGIAVCYTPVERLNDVSALDPVRAELLEAVDRLNGHAPREAELSAAYFLNDPKTGLDYTISTAMLPGSASAVSSWLLAAMAFLRLEFAAKERVPTKGLKTIPKPGGVGHDALVTRVVLRRVHPTPRGPQGEKEGGREFKVQWMVGAHWRRLHQPRKKDGAETTYVRPYLKGPDGAPLSSRVKLAHVKR